MLYLDHFGVTDAGKVRENNEDSFLTGDGRDETLFAVADGIGGFEAGEVASSLAIEALRELSPSDSLVEAIQEANRRVLYAARENSKHSGMGTTVVAVRFAGKDGKPAAEIAHVGDSRAYLLRDGDLTPLTEDHSLVAELVRSGSLTRAQALEHPQKNLITRALGAEEEIEVETNTAFVGDGDRLLLCSDGLSDLVPEDKMTDLLAKEPSPESSSQKLLLAALEAGGSDNITAVVVDIKKEDLPPEDGPGRSDDTREMAALVSEDSSEDSPTDSPPASRRSLGRKSPRRSGRKTRRKWFIKGLVRFLAGVLALAVIATPAYLWGSSRYFLGFEGGEVVLYRGLPYEAFGTPFNEEVEQTGLRRANVERPYRTRIQDHQLYTRDEADNVIEDLKEQ